DPGEARGQAVRRLRPRVGPRRGATLHASHRGPGRWNPGGLAGARGPRHLPLSSVREAMVRDPGQLPANASAQAAGELLQRPEVRAVFVTEDERLVGVVTRKTLVREVVAKGLDPRSTMLRELAEPPHYTLGAEVPLEDAFRFLEERDAERVPVVDD